MKKTLLSTTAIFALTATTGFAQSIAEQVVTQLQAEGYQRIEVKNGPNQVKVEAIRNGRKLEVVYDAATGAILDQEVEPVDDDDETSPGVEISDEDEDFIDDEDDDEGDDEDGDDDEDDDEDNDDADDEDDDEDDDNDDDEDDGDDADDEDDDEDDDE